MNPQPNPQDSLVLSYLTLRKAVGIIGFALPFVLAIAGPGIQGSISCYYYTDMRNVLVGSLCAIGVFLMSTRGYDLRDEIAGRLACTFSIGVALFPTSPCDGTRRGLIGYLHISFAALLFLTLAYFSIVLFTQTAPDRSPTPEKLRRNMVYRVCGYIILACILLIGVFSLPTVKPNVDRCMPIFWFEALAVVAFGASWLVKGETILKDKP